MWIFDRIFDRIFDPIFDWAYGVLASAGLFPKLPAKILILGLKNTGKTTLIRWLASNMPLEPTVQPTFKELTFRALKFVAVNAGKNRQGQRLWNDHLDDAHGIIFLVDAADYKRFPAYRAELDALLAATEKNPIPMIIYANKIDELYAVTGDEIISGLGLKYANHPCIKLLMGSMLLRQRIGYGIQWLLRHIYW